MICFWSKVDGGKRRFSGMKKRETFTGLLEHGENGKWGPEGVELFNSVVCEPAQTAAIIMIDFLNRSSFDRVHSSRSRVMAAV